MVELIVFLPLAAAGVVGRMRDESGIRRIAQGAAAAASLLCLGLLLAPGVGSASPVFRVDRLSATPMALFAGISLATLVAGPRRDIDRRFVSRTLRLLSSTLAAYAAGNLIVLAIAWIVAAWNSGMSRTTRIAGAISLVSAAAMIQMGVEGPAATTMLILAAILQTGIFPAHRLAIGALDRGPMLLSALSMNSQLGVFLIARQLPGDALPWVSGLALFTGLYAAVLGIAERDPRRLLASVMVSQSAALLAGFASGSPEGQVGALVQWIVLALSSTALVLIYRGVEVRIGGNPGPLRFLGLAAQAPRLGAFFAVSGLALVGLPGTLGFTGQHLLVHGALATHSWWGVALPIATALNACHVFALFTHLFLGTPEFRLNTVSDALPRERWALAVFVVLLIVGGLAPGRLVPLPGQEGRHDVQNQAMSIPRK